MPRAPIPNQLRLETLEDRLSPASLTVNSTADTANPTDPYLTLREAVAIVNSPTLPDNLSDQILGQIDGDLHEDHADTIVFDPGQVAAPIVLAGRQLELSLPSTTAAVTIDGGSGVTVDGSDSTRVFQIDRGTRSNLDHLTISHGRVGAYSDGGGVLNSGELTLTRSTLFANSAGAAGGGISNPGGTLTVINSTLAANSASDGGGIYNFGTLTVINSTLAANSANQPTLGYGGGISNLTIGTLLLQDTIVAGNHTTGIGPDISGPVTGASSHNLVGDGTDLLGISNGVSGNLVGSAASPIDPRLGPLADNGGPTRTYALLPDSPARGAGSLDFATTTDQRGLPRTVDGEIDLGSFQTQTAVAGPQVVLSDPDGVIDPPVDHVRLTFNHPLDPASLTAGRFRLSGPAGVIPVTRVDAVGSSDDQQLDVGFASRIEPGGYALTVGPGLRDSHGTGLDSPQTVRFIVFGPGSTLTVNSMADTANPSDPWLTLREAIALVNSPSLPDDLSPQIRAQIGGTLHANGSDVIVFDPAAVTGPIRLSGTQLELSVTGRTTRVTIEGGSGVTVDGNNASRVLSVDAGVQATLDHLTLTRGHTPASGLPNYGAGIFNFGTLTLTDSTLSANSAGGAGGGIYNHGPLTVTRSALATNSASTGGGICNNGGSLTVIDSTLSANSASDDGGGIGNESGLVTVNGSTLTANSANRAGGGIYNNSDSISSEGGTLTVTNSTLSANSGGDGGGIYNYVGTVTVTTSTLSANFGDGGGIFNQGGTVRVSRSTLASNSARYFTGGGIFSDNGTVTLTGSTLSGNSASMLGGGIYSLFGTLTVTNSTLGSNSADQGGGIYDDSGTVTVSHSTLAANSAHNDGGGIYNRVVPRTSLVVGDTIVAGNGGGDIVGDYTSSHSLVGGDPRLAPLGYYGGPTPTFALLSDSPALGAGDPNTPLTTDQRGLPRVVGGLTDIGAFQTQDDPFLVTTVEDPGRLSGLLSLREAVSLANVLPGDDTISFDPALDGGLMSLTAGQLELSGSGGVLTLDGAGRFSLSGADRSRLVQVDPGTRAELRGLGLLSGNAPSGGGVLNQGTLTVASCTLYGNTAYNGGAILNQGLLTLSGSTLAFNVATLGAAIDNEGYLVAYNSTFAYNAALVAGGAIRNAATGTAILTSLTLSRNSADEGGGLDVLPGSAVLLRNSIVAGNYSAYARFASDVAGTLDPSSSYNLIGTGGSGGLSDGSQHNQVGVADPGLTTPDFSSPQTPVFGFTADSPALGAGDPSLLDDPLLGLDQHGHVRTVVNIGAL
jgi:hypothetical protein